MDLQTMIDVLFRLMAALCAALVVYGGLLCWDIGVWRDEKHRGSGPQNAPGGHSPAEPGHAAGALAVQAVMFNVGRKAKFLCSCLALAGIAYLLIASTDVAPTGSPVSSAAATEGARRTQTGTPARREGAATLADAGLDYFPANYLNQGRDGDGNVMTYEHD